MNTIDRMQAVSRSAKYKRDYDVYLKTLKPEDVDVFSYDERVGIIYSRMTGPGEALCRKYKIPVPIKPDAYNRTNSSIPAWELKLRIKSREQGTYGPDDILNVQKLPSVSLLPQEREDGALFWGPDEKTHQMAAVIDMMRPISEIKIDLEKLYHYFDKQNDYRNKKSKDRKDTTIQHGKKKLTYWQVHDRVNKDQVKIRILAKEMVGPKGEIGTDALKALCEAIRRANNKAIKQIQEVEKDMLP